MTVSFIIPTKNRGAALVELLTALECQSVPPDEIVIVDASEPPLSRSPFGTRIRGSRLRVKLIDSPAGVNRARNDGARASSGDLLFFFDDDVIPEPGYVAAMLETFRKHPEFGGGMGTVQPTTKRWSIGAFLCRLFLLQHEFGDGSFSWSGMGRHPYGTSAFRQVEVMGSGFIAVRRATFFDDGICFDESLPLALEDADYSYRLSRRHRLFFNPEARAEHRVSPIGRVAAEEQARRFIFCFRYLYLKNIYPGRPWTLPAHWWAVLGLFVTAAATARLDRIRGYVAGLSELSATRRGHPSSILLPGRQ